MSSFRLVVTNGVAYASTEIDIIYADDTQVLGEAVRHLIFKIAKGNEVVKNMGFAEYCKKSRYPEDQDE